MQRSLRKTHTLHLRICVRNRRSRRSCSRSATRPGRRAASRASRCSRGSCSRLTSGHQRADSLLRRRSSSGRRSRRSTILRFRYSFYSLLSPNTVDQPTNCHLAGGLWDTQINTCRQTRRSGPPLLIACFAFHTIPRQTLSIFLVSRFIPYLVPPLSSTARLSPPLALTLTPAFST